MLQEALPAPVALLGSLDGAALAVLDTARLLPEEVCRALNLSCAPS
jgi:hypothetical protein